MHTNIDVFWMILEIFSVIFLGFWIWFVFYEFYTYLTNRTRIEKFIRLTDDTDSDEELNYLPIAYDEDADWYYDWDEDDWWEDEDDWYYDEEWEDEDDWAFPIIDEE